MKYLILAAGAAVLSGCTSGSSKCDSGDTGCETNGGGTPLLWDITSNCSGGECTWTIMSDGQMGTVELSLVETGAPEYEDGCTGNVEAGGLACGVWSEYHNDFQLIEENNEFGGETKYLELTIVDSYEDVVQNDSTIFDLDSDPDGDGTTIGEQTTVLVELRDSSGNYADCATYGDLPDYFGNECTNVW